MILPHSGERGYDGSYGLETANKTRSSTGGENTYEKRE